MLRARMPRAGEDQSVDHAAHAHHRSAAALKLVIQKAEVERGVVRDERRIAKEPDQLLDLILEQRLVG